MTSRHTIKITLNSRDNISPKYGYVQYLLRLVQCVSFFVLPCFLSGSCCPFGLKFDLSVCPHHFLFERVFYSATCKKLDYPSKLSKVRSNKQVKRQPTIYVFVKEFMETRRIKLTHYIRPVKRSDS